MPTQSTSAKTRSPITLITIVVNTTILGPLQYEGQYALIAQDARKETRFVTVVTVPTTDAATPDESKLITLNAAFDRLASKIENPVTPGVAPYAITVFQAANNIHGWLAKGFRRRSARIIELTDPLLAKLDRVFPDYEFNRSSRAEIDTFMEIASQDQQTTKRPDQRTVNHVPATPAVR